MNVLSNVLEELEVQKIFLAEEIKTKNPQMLVAIKKRLPEMPIEFIFHTEMKKDLKDCKVFIRTGEMAPYSNVIRKWSCLLKERRFLIAFMGNCNWFRTTDRMGDLSYYRIKIWR